MSNFEWQTEDDYDWDEPEQKPSSAPNRYGQIGIAVLIVALLAGLGWMLNNRLRETVETATIQTEEDVTASFKLLHQSASARDIEVFNALLSGLDPDWTVGYQLMVGNNGLLDRSALGWEVTSEEPEISEVVLSPSLRAAEITATVEYAIPVGNGLHETVQIAQPAIFREGTTRWLYAPPEEGYWGDRQQQSGNFLSVSFPERDRDLVLDLQRDLELAIGNRCGAACDQTFIQVEFSTSPSALSDLRLAPLQVENYKLILPTPTLVGLPVDEAGYRALLGGYADLILTSLFTAQSAYQCCDHIAYHRAQSLWALKEGGLRAWPLTLEAYEAVLAAHTNFIEWPLGWELNRPSAVSAETQAIAYAVVEFLQATYPPSKTEFDTNNLNGFAQPLDWIAAIALNSNAEIVAGSPDEWQKMQFEAFQRFLVERIVQLEQAQTRHAAPTYQLMVACNGETTTSLQQYDVSIGQWTQAASFAQPISEIRTLPDETSLWVQFGDPATINSETRGPSAIWHDGELIQMSELRLSYSGVSNPKSGALIVNTPLLAGANGSNVPPTYYELDPTQCSEGNCPIFQQDGLPLWSEDGEHSLILSNRNLLTVQNVAGDILSDHFAVAGFWFDNDTYIWQPTLLNLMSSEIAEPDNREDWLAWSDLANALPEGTYSVPALVHFYWRDEQPEQLYVSLLNVLEGSVANVVFWDREANSAEFLDYQNTRVQEASPEGRYLLLREQSRSQARVYYETIHLYDTVTRTHHGSFAATESTVFSWISDSDQWATLTDGDQVRIINLLSGEQTFVSLPESACVSADWILPTRN